MIVMDYIDLIENALMPVFRSWLSVVFVLSRGFDPALEFLLDLMQLCFDVPII